MTWEERIKEAAYTSPETGTRIVFTYEDVRRSVDKLTSAYNFPGTAGTFVQDLGRSGRRFPLRVIFWGDNYDLEAAAFETLLLERGVGTLEHPLYGTFEVVPFGTIERRDNLKTAANQAVIDVNFWESTGAIFPTDQASPEAEAKAALLAYNEAAAAQFAERADISSAVERSTFRNQVKRAIDVTRSTLKPIADTLDSVARETQFVYDSIDTGIDLLVGEPLALAFQTSILIQSPARALAAITGSLTAYRALADSIFSNTLPTPSFDNIPNNEFLTLDHFNQGTVSGAALASVSFSYDNQTEAILAADALASLMTDVTDWRDIGFVGLEEVDTGESYQALQTLVATTLGALVQISLRLPQERSLTLDRPRALIELVAELYGEIDTKLDEFINLNNLSGDEIIELPLGRRVVYYV